MSDLYEKAVTNECGNLVKKKIKKLLYSKGRLFYRIIQVLQWQTFHSQLILQFFIKYVFARIKKLFSLSMIKLFLPECSWLVAV